MTTTATQPKRFRRGAITLTLTPGVDWKGRTTFATSFGKRVRNRRGEWREVSDYHPSDLPVLHSLVADAVHWLASVPPDHPREEPPSPSRPDPEAERLARLLQLIEMQFSR